MTRLVVLALFLSVVRASTTTPFPCEDDLECVDPSGCSGTYCDDDGFCQYSDSWSFEECTASGCLPRKCVGGTRDTRNCIRQEDCPEGSCQGFQCVGGQQDGLACLPLDASSMTSFATTGPWSVEQYWVFGACEYSGGVCTGSVCYYGGELELVNCMDATACTADVCNASLLMPERCSHTEIVCNDGDDCNGVETCDPYLGCQAGQPFSPLNCDDGLACSIDFCNGTSQRCEYDYSMCGNCSRDEDCDDGRPMTSDYCATGRCSESGAPCSECLECGARGGLCLVGGLSSCLHIPAFCPIEEPQGWIWPPLFVLIGLLVLLTIWGVFAALQRQREHKKHHHEGNLRYSEHYLRPAAPRRVGYQYASLKK
jgi:hypothetical protein